MKKVYCIFSNDCYDGRLIEVWTSKQKAEKRLKELNKKNINGCFIGIFVLNSKKEI